METSAIRLGSKLALNLLDLIAAVVAVVLVVAPQYYLLVAQPAEDWTVFAMAVAVPLIFGSAILLSRGMKVTLLVFLAYLWSVTDDAPVNLDSVYTWPAVTSGLQHTVTEVVLHLLTVLFLYLAVRKAWKPGERGGLSRALLVFLLTMTAFAFASASIIPIAVVEEAVRTNWYQVDVVAHLLSLGFLSGALWIASRGYGRSEGEVAVGEEEGRRPPAPGQGRALPIPSRSAAGTIDAYRGILTARVTYRCDV